MKKLKILNIDFEKPHLVWVWCKLGTHVPRISTFPHFVSASAITQILSLFCDVVSSMPFWTSLRKYPHSSSSHFSAFWRLGSQIISKTVYKCKNFLFQSLFSLFFFARCVKRTGQTAHIWVFTQQDPLGGRVKLHGKLQMDRPFKMGKIVSGSSQIWWKNQGFWSILKDYP